jgi:hypothetical protein
MNRFFSPDQGDEPGVGIAKDPLQSAASTESLSADRQAGHENNAESVWTRFMGPPGYRWPVGAKYVSPLLVGQDSRAGQSGQTVSQPASRQAGCGVGEEDDLSFTHSNPHRATFLARFTLPVHTVERSDWPARPSGSSVDLCVGLA